MSSPDPGARPDGKGGRAPAAVRIDRRHGLVGAVLFAVFGLAGCQFSPLYADPATGLKGPVRVQDTLAAVRVGPPRTRAEQILRNELVFLFTGGSEPPEPQYDLELISEMDAEPLAVSRDGDEPGVVLVTMRVTFILSEIATGRTILTGNSFQTASYSFSSQAFANEASARDAESRVAKAVAENIAIRLGAFFKARQTI